MIEFIIIIFLLALILYAVFAGADFGAGIVEFFVPQSHREEEEELISHALAPVWEANHVWLILALVILFSAFPKIFSEFSTIFHLPLLLMLMGIVLRGCAFTFRHYDPFYDGKNPWYTRIFITSSFLAPFAQGLVVGGCMLGRIPKSSSDFFSTYIAPWGNLFCGSVGVFLCGMYFFIASVFLLAETNSANLQERFLRRVYRAIGFLFLSSLLVFWTAEMQGFYLFRMYRDSPASRGGVLSVILLLVGLVLLVRRRRFQWARICAASIVGIILCSWFAASFPYVIGGHPDAWTSFDLFQAVAPYETLQQLSLALAVGALLIFPALGFLFHVFKNPRRLSAPSL